MKTPEQIIEAMEEILNDERFWYQPANVAVNAPLALIQVAFDNKLAAYGWVLGFTSLRSIKDQWLLNKKITIPEGVKK